MKEIFMPTMDELYKMQDMGGDIRLYLYAKAIESLCIEYANYPRKGTILGLEYRYIQENEIISHAICRMYPEEIKHSMPSQYDLDLAKYLIQRREPSQIYRLDNISNFSSCITDHQDIIDSVIQILSTELKENPKYRFEYRQSQLLDSIFQGRIKARELHPGESELSTNLFIRDYLSQIEPYYVLQSTSTLKNTDLQKAIIAYINRYGFNYQLPKEPKKQDVLTNMQPEVKRLIKCIKRK